MKTGAGIHMQYAGKAGWRLTTYPTLGSTNDLARALPPWSAVTARRQSAARGRFGRSFVSDAGGLWLSAVLPADGRPAQWIGFSLMVGAHLLRFLRALGVPQARLRWPNDLMAGGKKIAGLLIEQDARETLTVGLGLNVTNSPWSIDPTLAATTSRLADLLPATPDLDSLTVGVLDALADAHAAMLTGGLSAAIAELNPHWAESRPVELALLGGSSLRGCFTGLDPHGNLRILDASGRETIVEHRHVQRLHELTP